MRKPFGIKVQGGTDAGWKIKRDPDPWFCACFRKEGVGTDRRLLPVLQLGKRYSCGVCGERRPS